MTNNGRLINALVHFRQLSFIQIIQRTMVTLFPIALIGSVTGILSYVLFTPSGFLGSVLGIRHWLPQYRFFQIIFNDASVVTVGFLAPYAAFISAQLKTRQHHREVPSVGVTAMACYVLLFYHSVRLNNSVIDMRYYTANWFIVGVVVGYIVGWIFIKLGRQTTVVNFNLKSNDILKNVFSNMAPILVALTLAFIIHLGYALIRQWGLDMLVNQNIAAIADRHSNYANTMLIAVLATVMTWLGFAESINISNEMFRNKVFANLNYALTHKTNLNVPYPFTPAALYNGFGQFGGVGLSLALLIAILWVNHHRSQRAVAKASAMPVFFNTNLPLAMGCVVMLNPIYLVPFVLLPLFNMVVASGLIMFHLIPPLVYPAPYGTPGILTSLVESGGNWWAFFWSLALLVIDVLAYVPFVKLADRVEDTLSTRRGDGDNDGQEN